MKSCIIFLGAPGSGKGTQAEWLSKEMKLEKVSTGDLIRSEIQKGTVFSKKISPFILQGKLVPDRHIFSLLKKKLAPLFGMGFILDGYPRNYNQAIWFDKFLSNYPDILQMVFYLNLKLPTLISRVCGRRICDNCKKIYHIKFFPTKDNVYCDSCGGKLTLRIDDNKEMVSIRYGIFKKLIRPVITFYGDRIHEVDAEQSQWLVSQEIKKYLSHDHFKN